MICLKCGKEFPNSIYINGKRRILTSRKFCLECSPFQGHNRINLVSQNRVQEEVICQECGKTLSKRSLKTHMIKTHNMLPPKSNRTSWNKGLTNEDDRIFQLSKKRSEALTEKPGLPHTVESKKKISKARIKYLNEHPECVPYLLNHSSKMSYPEKVLMDRLISENIKGWKYHYQNGIYQYDFAFVDIKLDIEIDGSTHLQENVIQIDKRRDEWSKNNGWTILRFTAKEIKHNLAEVVTKILSCVNTLHGSITQLDSE